MVAAALVAFAYTRSYQIYQQLAQTFPQLAQARTALAGGRFPQGDPIGYASGVVGNAMNELDRGSIPFRFTESLPFLGRPLWALRDGVLAAQEETTAGSLIEEIVQEALGPSGASGPGAGSVLFQGGAVNTRLLAELTPQMEQVRAHLQAGDRYLRAIPPVPFLSHLQELKMTALEQSAQALTLADRAVSGLKLLPGLLGAKKPQTYFLALQNNADLRGTGGAVLGVALIRVQDGRLSLLQADSVNHFEHPGIGEPGTFPPAVRWFLHMTGAVPRINNGANYSPDFPVVAVAWQRMVHEVTGIWVDGAVAVDPQGVALALQGQRPIAVPGLPERLSASTVVPLTENLQYGLSPRVQRDLARSLVRAAFRSLVHPSNFVQLLRHLSTALLEKRLQVWSADPALQGFVAKLGWDGGLRGGPGDYLYLVDDKRNANKVDYFTTQSITDDVRVLPNGAAECTVTIRLTNDTPPGQVREVVGHWSPYALNLAMLNLYVPGRARLEHVAPSGTTFADIQPAWFAAAVHPRRFVSHAEDGFLVLTQTIPASPGRPGVLVYRYTVPGVVVHTPSGDVYRLTIQHQPTVLPQQLTVNLTLPTGAVISSAPGWRFGGNVATLRLSLTRDTATQVTFLP